MSATTLSQPVHTSEGWVLRLLDEEGHTVGTSEPFTRLLDAVAHRESVDESGCSLPDESCDDRECGQPIFVADQHVDTYYCGFCLESFEAHADGLV